MESVNCSKHGKPCFLKTGVKDGPNYGRSFYICSNVSERCDFADEAKEIEVTECPDHPGYKVELQALNSHKHSNEKSLYYRCALGRTEKKHWCGHNMVQKSSPTVLKAVVGNVQPDISSASKATVSKVNGDHLSSTKQEKTKSSPRGEKSPEKADKPNLSKTQNKQVDKIKKTGNMHNESFESLAAKARSKKPATDIACTKDAALNDSQLRYRSAGADCQSDSDDSDVSTDSDRGTVDGGNDIGRGMAYRDTSVVTISSSDSEDESTPENTKVTARDLKEVQQSKTHQISQHAHEATTSSMISSLNSGTSQIETVVRPDGVRVIKIVKPSTQSTVKPPADKQDSMKSKTETVSRSTESQTTTVASRATSALPKSTNGNDLLSLVKEKNKLITVLNHQKSIMQKVNLAMLPDKGAKIKGNIDDLTAKIADLDINIKSSANASGAKPKVIVIPSSQLQKTVAGQVLPPGVKQTKLTDHGVTSLPQQVFQQMYADNPQMSTLYGGRMTAARLREVGSVTSEAIERLHKQLDSMPNEQQLSEDPDGILVSLMPHQKHAMTWLTWREEQHPPGGILADDMGLGKTLTSIALVIKQRAARKAASGTDKKKSSEETWLKKAGANIIKSFATLIVCPASVIHQWDREITRRCEEDLLSVILYHGPNREKDMRKLAGADIVLTTYNLIGREVGVPPNIKDNKHMQDMAVEDQEPADGMEVPGLLRIAWERIILDEAHNIKNHKSVTAQSVCRLRALYRWALTGTPIQNDLLDMYSLLRFLRCSPFDEYKLWKRQVDNKSTKGTQRLNMLVKTLLLRRTKEQTTKEGKRLIPLPDKSSTTHELKLKEEEKSIYDKIFEQSRATMQNYLKRHDDKSKDGTISGATENPWAKDDLPAGASKSGHQLDSRDQQPSGQPAQAKAKPPGGGQILLLLLRLRQCCSHLSLMKDSLDVEALQQEGLDLDIVEQMRELALKEEGIPEEPKVKVSSVFEVEKVSSKIETLLLELQKIRENSDKKAPSKSVIVSQWTKMLEVVESHLKKEGFRCCTIKGNVAAKQRAELVDSFNMDPHGPEIMLVSLRAGGVGLNLIGGNHMFVIDMHWNPALEQQACDRVYRVGQKRNVHIHRFICVGTVEEKIRDLQNKKLSLAKNVLTGAGASSNKLTLADLRMLFDLDRPVTLPTNFNKNTAIQTTQFRN